MKNLEIKTLEALPAPSDVMTAYLDTAGTAETYTVPDGAAYVFFKSTGDFYAKYIEHGDTLDLVTNGAFATDTDWTKGDGWTIGSGVASCDGSQAANTDLEQDPSALNEGQAYRVIFTVSNYSAGTVTPVIGGTAGTSRSANGTYTETIIAGSGDAIALRGNASFAGDADDFSVAPIAVLPTADNTNTFSNELNPDKRFIANTKQISLVASANSTIVTMAFYKER